MENEDLREALKNLLIKESNSEKAYAAYAELVESHFGLSHVESPTHVIQWGQRVGRASRVESILISMARLFGKSPPPAKPSFRFESYHRLDAGRFEELRASMQYGVEVENLSSLSAGVSFWMFGLSLFMILFVKGTAIALAIASVLVFLGAILWNAKAHFKFLPPAYRNISADHWAIRSVKEVSKESP